METSSTKKIASLIRCCYSKSMNHPTTWREYLISDFQNRKNKNPRYSLRAYSKTLGISAAHLSLILSGQRKLKAKSALKIGKSLGLTSTETISLLEGEASPNRLSHFVQTRTLNEEEFSLISSWHFFAILGLANLQPNVADPKWISKKLGIPLAVAKKSFQDLVDLKYIEVTKGQFRQLPDPLRTKDDVPSDMIRKYHKQTLQLAAEKIDHIPVDAREYTNMTIAINPNRIHEAKKLIRRFKEEFTYEVSRGKKSEVYNLCVQFFPLTEPTSVELAEPKSEIFHS